MGRMWSSRTGQIVICVYCDATVLLIREISVCLQFKVKAISVDHGDEKS